MNKLEILAAFFPFGLKCHCAGLVEDDDADETTPIVADLYCLQKEDVTVYYADSEKESNSYWCGIDEMWPILRPLSQLNESIKHKGEEFVPIEELREELVEADGLSYGLEYVGVMSEYDAPRFHYDGRYPAMYAMPYHIIQKMRSWMFDVDGLISKKEAVDVTTLKNDPYEN